MMRMAGARDTVCFKASITQDKATRKKPSVDSITYEGIYCEHPFHTGHEEKKIVSCTPHSLISKDPLSENPEYYLGLFINSKYDGQGIVNRPPLNLVICLDISGSMNSAFRSRGGETKISVAKESLKTLLNQLQPDDSICIVTFNTEANVLFHFAKKKSITLSNIHAEIDNIFARGGTNLENGIRVSAEQFLDYGVFNGEGGQEGIDLENRIIYLTDMCPNIGTSDGKGLLDITKENADNRLYTTFVGLGVDFDSKLVEIVSKTHGCNYLSVNTNQEFKKLMEEDFNYLVFPVAMNVNVSLTCDKFDIERIYGSPGFEKPVDGTAVKIHTLFPSYKPSPEESKGGIILLKLLPKFTESETKDYGSFQLRITYELRSGLEATESISDSSPFSDEEDSPFVLSLRKGILLTRYVNLMRHWICDNSQRANREKGILPFDRSMMNNTTTHSGSKDCTSHFTEVFSQFHTHFMNELETLPDDATLLEEANLVAALTKK